MSAIVSSVFREITAERASEYVGMGHKRRRFFPHRVYHLPKCGPDGLKLAKRMCDINDPTAMWELVLYADSSLLTDLPPDLFFDDDLIWHRQQFGRPGQVASASIVLDGTTVFSITRVSDLVQRISRRREHKTRIEKRFDGWRHMLLNAVLGFAAERGARRVVAPTGELAHRHTDDSREVGAGLFKHIYDRAVTDLYPARRDGEWWVIDLAEARDRLLMPERRTEARPGRQAICICHEIDRTSARHLAAMRRIESELDLKATYFVPGSQLAEVRDGLEAEGHSLAFHAFDRRLERQDQLHRCRLVDYRIKGYRPPRSVFTPELSDRNLLFHNFEWVASSPRSLGVAAPEMRAGLVRLPIAFDDFPLHVGRMGYEEWERELLSVLAASEFAAISLHDCHALHWLPRYRSFLEKLRELGTVRTMDEVAADVTLCSGS